MVSAIRSTQYILDRVRVIDDQVTGGGIGGTLRRGYRYLLGVKNPMLSRAKTAKEIDVIADLIREEELPVNPKVVEKLANIVARCSLKEPGDDKYPAEAKICISALDAIEAALEKPVRDMADHKIIARLNAIIRMHEVISNTEFAERVQRTVNVIERQRAERPRAAGRSRPGKTSR